MDQAVSRWVNGVIEAFGGLTAMAAATGDPISTIATWKKVGRVPRWRRQAISDAAARLNIILPDHPSDAAAGVPVARGTAA